MSGAQYAQNNGQSGAVVAEAKPRELAPADLLRRQLTSLSGELGNALPSHIKPEKFQRVVMTVVQQNPGLLNADRKSLLAASMKCAADGLLPDGREAAFVMFGSNVQYMPMMAGIQKRVRNSGEVAGIEAHVIYSEDHFVWRQGLDATIQHTPKFPGDRGKPIGAYAVAKFKDGSQPQFEVMDIAAIERVRNVSKSKNSGPWVQWFDEMARKTVFRRLSKWLPMDANVDDLAQRDDENDHAAAPHAGTTVDARAEPPTQQISAPSKLDALEGDVVDVSEWSEPPPADEPEAAAVALSADAVWLVEQIEGAADDAALDATLSSSAIKAKARGMSADERKAVETAVAAARHGFKRGAAA